MYFFLFPIIYLNQFEKWLGSATVEMLGYEGDLILPLVHMPPYDNLTVATKNH